MRTKNGSLMRVPGFTAEAALYKKSAYYGLHSDVQRRGVVQPAFYRCWGNFCCDEWGNCINKGPRLM
jgi:hypothetical protein